MLSSVRIRVRVREKERKGWGGGVYGDEKRVHAHSSLGGCLHVYMWAMSLLLFLLQLTYRFAFNYVTISV